MVQHTRRLASLADGHYAEAYEHLSRIHDPSDPAFHSFMRSLTVADLVEAATRSGETEAARPIVAERERLGAGTPAPPLSCVSEAGITSRAELRTVLQRGIPEARARQRQTMTVARSGD